jgi:AraC-like DNA-binding protein
MAVQSAECADLLVTDIGYFPEANWHKTERLMGSPQMILIYCVSGNGWAEVGSATHQVRPGQMLIIAPHQAHRYGSNAERPWTIYWLHVTGRKTGAIHRLLTGNGQRIVVEVGEDPECISTFEEVFETLRQSYGPDNLLIASLATAKLLGRLITLYRRDPEVPTNHQRIMHTIDFMKQRLTATISVSELARMVNTSRSHYAALFKRETGYAVLDFFIRLKMQHAASLLDKTDRAVKSIAGELGFNDPLYFSRQFHRVYHMSPTSYRAIKKG